MKIVPIYVGVKSFCRRVHRKDRQRCADASDNSEHSLSRQYDRRRSIRQGCGTLREASRPASA